MKANKFILQDKRFDIFKKYHDDELKRPGIYAIVNIKNGHSYVGKSEDLLARRRVHFGLLKSGKHFNPYLQNAYNCYGKGMFRFVVLELVEKLDELQFSEQHWIEVVRPAYNIVKNVFEFPPSRIDKSDTPDGKYSKDDETFVRPAWHAWVYGGARNPILDR